MEVVIFKICLQKYNVKGGEKIQKQIKSDQKAQISTIAIIVMAALISINALGIPALIESDIETQCLNDEAEDARHIHEKRFHGIGWRSGYNKRDCNIPEPWNGIPAFIINEGAWSSYYWNISGIGWEGNLYESSDLAISHEDKFYVWYNSSDISDWVFKIEDVQNEEAIIYWELLITVDNVNISLLKIIEGDIINNICEIELGKGQYEMNIVWDVRWIGDRYNPKSEFEVSWVENYEIIASN